MKMFVTAIALLSSTSFVHADYKIVSADDSALSQLCVAAAAADSREAVLALTDAAGIARLDVPTVLCNGMPLTRFSLKYGNAKLDAAVESKPQGDPKDARRANSRHYVRGSGQGVPQVDRDAR